MKVLKNLGESYFTTITTRMSFALSSFFVLLVTCLSAQAIVNADHSHVVNTDTGVKYDDLQTAIDAANSGDELKLHGTFVGNFTISNNLILKGENKAVLDGNQTGTVLTLNTNSSTTVTLESLTIQNGRGSSGGGILNEVNLILNHVKVINNTSTGNGGGIYNDSDAVFTAFDTKIERNVAVTNGGGIYNNSSGTVTLIETKINLNTAALNGGGVDNNSGSLSLQNCELSNNTSTSGNGAGVYNYSNVGVATVTQTKIEKNTASSGNGGGFFTFNSQTNFDDVKVDDNVATNGAGIYNDGAGVLSFTNSKLHDNIASGSGGGLYNNSGTVNITYSKVTENEAGISGGGILNALGQTVTIEDSKVRHNTPDNVVNL